MNLHRNPFYIKNYFDYFKMKNIFHFTESQFNAEYCQLDDSNAPIKSIETVFSKSNIQRQVNFTWNYANNISIKKSILVKRENCIENVILNNEENIIQRIHFCKTENWAIEYSETNHYDNRENLFRNSIIEFGTSSFQQISNEFEYDLNSIIEMKTTRTIDNYSIAKKENIEHDDLRMNSYYKISKKNDNLIQLEEDQRYFDSQKHSIKISTYDNKYFIQNLKIYEYIGQGIGDVLKKDISFNYKNNEIENIVCQNFSIPGQMGPSSKIYDQKLYFVSGKLYKKEIIKKKFDGWHQYTQEEIRLINYNYECEKDGNWNKLIIIDSDGAILEIITRKIHAL